MTAINFPSSPSTNDTYTFNGRTWKYNGAGWEAVATTLVQIDTQTFTSSTTYTIPATAQFILVECVGAGGGGSRGGANGYTEGGGGGAGGGYWREWVAVSELSSTATVTIGAGGLGGTSGTPDGAAGGLSRFGTLYYPGAAGTYNIFPGFGFDNVYNASSSSSETYGAGSSYPGKDSYKGGGGGGVGGYSYFSNIGQNGGKSYSNTQPLVVGFDTLYATDGNGAAGGAAGANGSNGTGSDGGGGGGGSSTGNAGNGGNGGTPGGGGGGGGYTSFGGGTQGNGGNGGNAQIKIWVYG